MSTTDPTTGFLFHTTSDTISSLPTYINDSITPINNWAKDRMTKNFKWANTAAKTAQTGMTEGDIGYQLDTNVQYTYDGAAWIVPTASGLVPIIPTSASAVTGTVTIGTSGKITFTTVGTSFSVNGCFTSAYDNYLILLRHVNSSTGYMKFTLRLAGTDATAAQYDWQRSTALNATNAAARGQAEVAWQGLAVNPYPNAIIRMDLFNPALAVASQMFGNMSETDLAGNVGLMSWAGGHRALTAYDGMTFGIVTGGTETGTLRIYGYNNN